jgi:HEAT repeat protein
MLTDKAPRVKWESARVIGNIAHIFPTKLQKPIIHLLTNTENEGTVVRWASSYALGEIIQLKTKHNKTLIPAIEAILDREQDNTIKKKYLAALKKVKN